MIIWSRAEIEYVLRTAIECDDREYAAWLIEQALQKAWDHELKVDWYNTEGSTLAQWDAKYNPPLCEDEGCDHYGTPHICRTLNTTKD